MSTDTKPESAMFGFQEIPASQKTGRVKEVFHRVASNYDLMNDVMSAGVHRLWKEQFVSKLQPLPGMSLLDVAGGTGDIAFRFIEHIKSKSPPSALRSLHQSNSSVVVCDINESMLRVGQDRATERGYNVTNTAPSEPNDTPPSTSGQVAIEFVQGNAEKLPFEDSCFDAYTIAFGIRNVTQMDLALQEAHRVLRPGGRFMCLEFSHLAVPVLREIYDAYSFNVIPALGEWVAQDRESYQYLVESIRNFPTQEEFVRRIKTAGFRHVDYENLTFGVVAIHSGFKL